MLFLSLIQNTHVDRLIRLMMFGTDMDRDRACCAHCAGMGKKNPLGLPGEDKLDLQESPDLLVRVGRNIFSHMTLQQKPVDFDVLVQPYRPHGVADEDGKQEVLAAGEACACNLKDASPAELVANTSVWTLEAIEINANNSSDAGILLRHMADCKAWGSRVPRVGVTNEKSFYIPDSDNDSACQRLLDDGLIVRSKAEPCSNQFYITSKGATALQMRLKVGSKRSLEDFHKPLGCKEISDRLVPVLVQHFFVQMCSKAIAANLINGYLIDILQ